MSRLTRSPILTSPARRGATRLPILVALGLILGCGTEPVSPPAPPPPPPVPTTLSLSASTLTLEAIGQSVQMVATVRDQNGQILAATVSWTSSSAAVATVSTEGVVAAVANGSATVTASAGSLTATVAVTVHQKPAGITVSPGAVTLTAIGTTATFTAAVEDPGGTEIPDAVVSWTSAEPAVASVAGDGIVTAVGKGTVTITAAIGALSATGTVIVDQRPSQVTVTPTTVDLPAFGATVPLTVVAKDAGGAPIAAPVVTWSTSSATVATVSPAGVVTAVGNGTATITATVATVTATTAVTVSQLPAGVSLTPSTTTLTVGTTATLTAAVTDGGGAAIVAPTVNWVSSNPTVASVSGTGVVTAVAKGSAVITATAGTAHGTAQVTIVAFDDRGDLGIGWIHRAPAMSFVQGSTNPTREGWPSAGQTVIWKAMVKNWSVVDRKAVGFRWTVDGIVVGTGTVDLPAQAYRSVDLALPWAFTRSLLRFEIDPASQVAEVEERNNSLEVFTDALSVGFYVERGLYNFFAQHQSKLGIGSNSWEDWAQRQVRLWNQMLRDARFPLTPNGVLDRIRIDQITVVNDGALPLAGGFPTNHPNLADRTVDLQWGFPAVATAGYRDFTTVSNQNSFYFEGSLFHEVGHARYLIDVYGFNAYDGSWTPNGITGRGSNIAITEGGQLVAGSAYMPVLAWEHVFYTSMNGLMNGDYSFVDEYSAAALNRIAGHRAVLGNANAPGNIGVFLNDLPVENRLTVRDPSGNPLAGASVKVYQAGPKSGQWYGKFYDDVPDLALTADAQGRVLLGTNPFGGRIVHTFGHANGVIILRVEHQGRVGYGFFESFRLNMEWWRGHTSLGEYDLKVTLR